MQELWRSGVSWDEPLDQEYTDTWKRIAETLQTFCSKDAI